MTSESQHTNSDPANRRDLGQILLHNTIATSVGSWTIKLLNFGFIIFVVRSLGEVGLGRYATVVAFVGLFSVFFELGLSQYVERDIARDSRRAEKLFWNLVVLRLILAVFGVAGVSLAANLFGYDPALTLGIFIFTLTFVFAAVLVPLVTLLKANERFDAVAIIEVAGQLLTILVGVTFLSLGFGFYSLLFAGFVAMPLQIVVAVIATRRLRVADFQFRVTPREWRGFVYASLPFGLTSLALTFNFNVDTVILGLFRDDGVVGWYNASYRLIFNVVGLVGGFLLVMTPSIAREHVMDPERVRRWVHSSLSWILIFAIPASAGLILLAPRVINLLYGSDYAPAAPALAILALDIPLLFLISFFGNVTAAVGLERPAAGIYLGAAGLNVVLNLALIPAFGILAAASVTIATDVISAAVFLILLERRMGLPRSGYRLPQIAVGTAVMMAAVLLLRSMPLPVVVGISGFIYLIVANQLKLLNLLSLLRAGRRVLRRETTAAY